MYVGVFLNFPFQKFIIGITVRTLLFFYQSYPEKLKPGMGDLDLQGRKRSEKVKVKGQVLTFDLFRPKVKHPVLTPTFSDLRSGAHF